MNNLNSFVRRQLQERNTPLDIDTSRRKEKWLEELNKIFHFIKNSLIKEGFPEDGFKSSEHRINEEFIGTYNAPGLILNLPKGGNVVFTPIGSVIIGGYGRIDVSGPARANIKLIATGKESLDSYLKKMYELEWEWKVYLKTGYQTSFPLDEEGLAQLLTSVTDSY